jgi:hypothetical protein
MSAGTPLSPSASTPGTDIAVVEAPIVAGPVLEPTEILDAPKRKFEAPTAEATAEPITVLEGDFSDVKIGVTDTPAMPTETIPRAEPEPQPFAAPTAGSTFGGSRSRFPSMAATGNEFASVFLAAYARLYDLKATTPEPAAPSTVDLRDVAKTLSEKFTDQFGDQLADVHPRDLQAHGRYYEWANDAATGLAETLDIHPHDARKAVEYGLLDAAAGKQIADIEAEFGDNALATALFTSYGQTGDVRFDLTELDNKFGDLQVDRAKAQTLDTFETPELVETPVLARSTGRDF